jgi:hypothetical protein
MTPTDFDLSRLRLMNDTAYLADDDGEILVSHHQLGLTWDGAQQWAIGVVQGYDLGFAAAKALRALQTLQEQVMSDRPDLFPDTVSFPAALAKFTGSHIAAMVLFECLKRGRSSAAAGNDSFAMSQSEWERKFLLSRRQVDGVRSLLEPHGILMSWTTRTKDQTTLNYSLGLDRFIESFIEYQKTGKTLERLVALSEWHKMPKIGRPDGLRSFKPQEYDEAMALIA